mgnify:CR=1 FL=1
MDKLFENVKKELKQIETNGLSSSNLDTAYKLTCIGKNIKEIEEKEGEGKMKERYMEGGYNARGNYRDDDDYGRRYRDDGYSARGGNYREYDDGYGRRGVPGSGRGGRYRGPEGERFSRHMDHIEDGVDMYMYGRERYFDSGDKHRMQEGLEKFMYGICMFVETAMDFAETPEEKEIIRKHIQKMKAM